MDEQQIPQNVIESLADVRASGLTNMFDRTTVIEIIEYWGDDPETTAWLNKHRDRYMDALNAMGAWVSKQKKVPPSSRKLPGRFPERQTGMNKHEGTQKGFVHHASAWYANRVKLPVYVVDQITFGYYTPDGGTTGEMVMTWYRLGVNEVAPKLEVFNDAWSALATFADLIAALGQRDDQPTTPEQFCDLLREHGFVDLTQRKNGGQ